MSSDIAISVQNLTKTYRLFDHPGDRIKQALTFGRIKFHKEYTALKDVSFEVKKGETVGIIGKNGSGKSTLLQLICGILKPTSGSVTVNGRISALLELGSGFNPEFTGRENIYFQGTITGFSQKEMDTKVDDIITFADIGEFIDQPVRTYSSGMFVRLAFATAIHSEPDILVVDEALAVGDMEFQRRSLNRISEMNKKSNLTIIVVSHELRQIQRFCSRVLHFDHGSCIFDGDANLGCQTYYAMSFAKNRSDNKRLDAQAQIVSTGEVELLSIQFLNSEGDEISDISSGDPLRINILFKFVCSVNCPEFIVGTQAEDLSCLTASSTSEIGLYKHYDEGLYEIEYVLDEFPLIPGKYFVRFNILDANFKFLFMGEALKAFFVRVDPDGARKPTRLLNIKSTWHFSGQSYAPRHIRARD